MISLFFVEMQVEVENVQVVIFVGKIEGSSKLFFPFTLLSIQLLFFLFMISDIQGLFLL
jgi:hypothetical protein